MGMVSTMDINEALETGKEYLGKEFYKNIGQIQRMFIKRCTYCREILPKANFTQSLHYYRKGYCGAWCYEMENPPDISHVCKKCGVVVRPHYRKSGQSSGVYPTYCKEHNPNGRPRKNLTLKKENDIIEL